MTIKIFMGGVEILGPIADNRGDKRPQTKGKAMAQNDEKTETPREKFVRLAEGRVSKALEAMDHVRGLANKDRYDYTPGDVEAIAKALTGKVNEIVSDLNRGKPERV